MMPDATFRPGLELMTYLDGNLSSHPSSKNPALFQSLFLVSWWQYQHPLPGLYFLCSATIKHALDHYRAQLAAARTPVGIPHSIVNLADGLGKPAYTWHSSVNDDLPNPSDTCTRCRLYRAVAVGVVDQLRDTYNMVHACEIANEAEKAIAIRRASGFNELFEVALKKECDETEPHAGSEEAPEQGSGSGSGSKGKGKETERFGPEVEELKTWMKSLMLKAAKGASEWTWGVDLTEEDLC